MAKLPKPWRNTTTVVAMPFSLWKLSQSTGCNLDVRINGNSITTLMPGLDCSLNGLLTLQNFANFGLLSTGNLYATFGLV